MNMNEIMNVFGEFAQSQGLYGRLIRDIKILQEDDPIAYDELVTVLENQHFTSALDVILFIET